MVSALLVSWSGVHFNKEVGEARHYLDLRLAKLIQPIYQLSQRHTELYPFGSGSSITGQDKQAVFQRQLFVAASPKGLGQFPDGFRGRRLTFCNVSDSCVAYPDLDSCLPHRQALCFTPTLEPLTQTLLAFD